MTAKQERKPGSPVSIISVLRDVMDDSDYLKGKEPDDEWDFSNWSERSFRHFKGWILAEKFFQIADINSRMLTLRIVETDPAQFDVSDVKIAFVITPVDAKGFPTVLIGTDALGKEKILRSVQEPAEWHQIPEYFQDLANRVRKNGSFNTHHVTPDAEGSQWALFIMDVLRNKGMYPADFGPTDFIIRDRLELGPDEPYSKQDMLRAEMEITQEEMLMVGYADFIMS